MQELLSEKQIRLRIRAYDRLSEIFLVNSHFQRIAAGIGELEAVVRPGIYKARFRVGQKQVDQLIEVVPGAGEMEVKGNPLDFNSPVPLAGGDTEQDVQRKAAEELSRSASEKKGVGSWLFLFIREIGVPEAAPWAGVTLHDLEGALVAESNQGVCDQENGYFALHIEVVPGVYRLRVEEEPGEFYEMFVRTEAGWQTQVFALSEEAWLPDIDARRAALSSASVLMTEAGQGFFADNACTRQIELLRLGLLHNRPVLSKDIVDSLLKEEGLNPMEGLYAVHALLRQGSVDTALLSALLKKMPSAFVEHADVQAIMVSTMGNGTEMRPFFSAPPLFRASWDCIAQAVEQKKAIVPPGSLAAQAADGLMNTSLWLVHRLDSLEVEKGL
jgi:hypothetical protein